jgi:hypothetical protein
MERLEHAAASAEEGPTVEFERVPVGELDPRRIHERDAPFIITGFFDEPPLTWGWLRRQCGHTMVPMHPVPNKGNDWHSTAVRMRALDEVMDAIESGQHLSVIGTEQPFHEHPELRARVRIEQLAALLRIPLFREEIFLGGYGTSSAFHCAMGSNLFVMADGRRKWVLVDPRDSVAMYPRIGWNRHGPGMVSPIDSDGYASTQIDTYPLYAKVRKHVVTLEPGDILWNPSWWWHEVTSLGPSIGIPLRTAVGGGDDNWFYSMLTALSPFGRKYVVRAFVSHVLSGRARWRITDRMITDTFPGFPRVGGDRKHAP